MCYQNVVGPISLVDAGRRLIGIRFGDLGNLF